LRYFETTLRSRKKKPWAQARYFRGLEGKGVTNFFWLSSTLGIFVVTLDDIDDKIALYRSIAGTFLHKKDYQRLQV